MVTRKTAAPAKVAKKTTARKTPAKKTAPAATPPAAGEPAAAGEAAPVEKQKLIRDSFTMPRREYEQIGALKTRLMQKAHAIKKSELLRAGIAALAALSDEQLIAAVGRVHRIKTGRPKNEKTAPKKEAKKKS